MILSPSAYIPVITIDSPARIVCIDPEGSTLYSENIKILDRLKMTRGTPAERYHAFFSLSKRSQIIPLPPKWRLDLSSLIRKSELSDQSFILEEQSFEQMHHEKVILPTDLLIGIGRPSNLAASRNILLSGLELKGVGRNKGAVRLDFAHAWGGMYLTEAVTEFISSNICEYSTHLGSEKTLVIGIHGSNQERLHFKANSFILRKRSAPRVSQACRHFEDEQSREVFEAISKLDQNSIQQHLKKLTFQYFSSGLIGMTHMSFIPENAVLNGRYLDTNSIRMDGSLNQIQGSLLLSIDRIDTDQIKTLQDLKKITATSLSIENNSLRNYFDVLFDTYLAFKLQDDNFILNKNEDKEFILRTIRDVIAEIGCGEEVNQLIFNIIQYPLKKSISPNQIDEIFSMLQGKNIQVKKFETIQKDHQSMIRINFEITTKLRVREIFNKFNQAQTNPFEIFIMSFSRMIELIDVENNSLFTMLNLYVLKNVKILPFTLKDSNEVIENVCSFQDAEKLLSKEAVCFYCFSEEEGRIKRTKNEVLKEKNEIIVYGYDYLIDQTLHQQVMKPLLFQ